MSLEEELKTRVDPTAKNGPMRAALDQLRLAWRFEDEAQAAGTLEEWEQKKVLSIAAYAGCWRLVVAAQDCNCQGLCPRGAGCVDILVTGACPICGGPASICKPRHLEGKSCG